MINLLSTVIRTLVPVLVSLVSLQVLRAGEQTGSSLTDLSFEQNGGIVSPDGLNAENLRLREALAKAEKTMREMRQSMALATSEAEIFRRQALEIKLRMEALGSGAGGGEKILEERLLASVSEMHQLEARNNGLVAALIRLTEAVNLLTSGSASDDGKTRLEIEGAMRLAAAAISGADSRVEGKPVAPTLDDGLVISVKDELLLVVANLGRDHGIRVGMPFRVIRGNAIVGTVRVVDVREKFAGAVVQSLSSEENSIRIGDRLIVVAQP